MSDCFLTDGRYMQVQPNTEHLRATIEPIGPGTTHEWEHAPNSPESFGPDLEREVAVVIVFPLLQPSLFVCRCGLLQNFLARVRLAGRHGVRTQCSEPGQTTKVRQPRRQACCSVNLYF